MQERHHESMIWSEKIIMETSSQFLKKDNIGNGKLLSVSGAVR